MNVPSAARRLALALLILPLALLGPAFRQSPGPVATPSLGFAPFTTTFRPGISTGSLYQWQFNAVAGGGFVPDFTSESPSDVNFTYQREGSYVARLRIYDSDTGLPADYDVPVTVYPPPVPPTVLIAGSDPHAAGLGTPATFSAAATASPGLTVASYHWEFEGDGVSPVTTPGGPSSSASFTCPALGTYTVKVTAIDNLGLAGFATFTVNVTRPPSLTFKDPNAVDFGPVKGSPYAGRGDPFPVQVWSTPDTGRTIVEYRWDFDGDGIDDVVQPSTDTTDLQTFTYPVEGVYSLRVTAVDDAGISGSATVPIQVFLVFLDVSTGFLDYPTIYDATPFPYPGASVVSYDWEFGDGTTASTPPAGNPASHQFTLGSDWIARVTAHFSDGRSGSSPIAIFTTFKKRPADTYPPTVASLSVEANVAVPSDVTTRVGREVSFTATAFAGSGPNGNAALTQVAWDFDGDGLRDVVEDFTAAQVLQSTSTAKYQYQYPGEYTVQVVAGTTFGQTLSGTFKVTVAQGTPPIECWLVQPSNGKTVGGNHATLSARGCPANRIASVTFQVRRQGTTPWTTIATVTPPPATALSASWNTTLVPTGLYDLQAVVADLDGSTSTSWTIQPVTVKVDPLAPADEEETADADGIPQVRIQTVDASRGDRCEISQDTRIEFLPHSTTASGSNYARCRMERLGADPHPLETRFQGLVFVPGMFRRLDLGPDSLTAPARVCLYVPNGNVDQALAAAGIPHSAAKDLELTIYRFDAVATHSWVPLFSHVRQPGEALVRASMVAMGDLGVGFQAQGTSTRANAALGKSWAGCGALGVDGLLLVLLLSGLRRRP